MSDQETTRRDALKLAAAVAAFGTALGYRQAEAGAPTVRTPAQASRTELKFELKRLELKIYDGGGTLIHTCNVPTGQLVQNKKFEQKCQLKFVVNGNTSSDAVGWDLQRNAKT